MPVKTRRYLAPILAGTLLVFSLALAGCGQDRGSEETTSETTSSTK